MKTVPDLLLLHCCVVLCYVLMEVYQGFADLMADVACMISFSRWKVKPTFVEIINPLMIAKVTEITCKISSYCSGEHKSGTNPERTFKMKNQNNANIILFIKSHQKNYYWGIFICD